MAIAITLLVLGLHSDFERGSFARGLGQQWPAYVAYVAAFLYIASLWINHHDLFNRVAHVDARLNCLNLALLLVASSVPFPAAVLGSAVGIGDRDDQIGACLLYAGVGFAVPVVFIAIYSHLSRHPALLTDPTHGVRYTSAARRRAMVSIIVYPVTAGLAFVTPILCLGMFVALPVFFTAAVFIQERADAAQNRPGLTPPTTDDGPPLMTPACGPGCSTTAVRSAGSWTSRGRYDVRFIGGLDAAVAGARGLDHPAVA